MTTYPYKLRRTATIRFIVAAASIVAIAAGCGFQLSPPQAPDITDLFSDDTGTTGVAPDATGDANLEDGSGSDEPDRTDEADSLNLAPIIDVGEGVIVTREDLVVSLTASVEDPDGDIPSITWEQIAGMPVLNTMQLRADSLAFIVPEITSNLLADAELLFRVTADDGRGSVVTSEVILQIQMAGDATGDDVVDDADRLLVEDRFLNGGVPDRDGTGDLNGDGIVDLLDLTIVLEQMGRVLQ